MGDPKKLKKKYNPPRHPWMSSAIEEEGKLKQEYGLKNKTEIYLASTFLKKYKDIAKRLIAGRTAQGEKEKQQMMTKLQKLGLLQAGADLDQVLSIQLRDVLERRIQSLVYKKGLARSTKQARQFVTHRHIAVGPKEITSPSYLVSLAEEAGISFKSHSSLVATDHPERTLPQPKGEAESKEEKKKDTEAAEELLKPEDVKV